TEFESRTSLHRRDGAAHSSCTTIAIARREVCRRLSIPPMYWHRRSHLGGDDYAVCMVIRRNAAFRRLWAAGAVSLVGDWLSFVAVAILALSSGGGAFALALVFAAHA